MAVTLVILAVAAAFTAFCLTGLARADRVRYLPKWAWVVVSCLSVPWGGLAYLIAGRDRAGPSRDASGTGPAAAAGPRRERPAGCPPASAAAGRHRGGPAHQAVRGRHRRGRPAPAVRGRSCMAANSGATHTAGTAPATSILATCADCHLCCWSYPHAHGKMRLKTTHGGCAKQGGGRVKTMAELEAGFAAGTGTGTASGTPARTPAPPANAPPANAPPANLCAPRGPAFEGGPKGHEPQGRASVHGPASSSRAIGLDGRQAWGIALARPLAGQGLPRAVLSGTFLVESS